VLILDDDKPGFLSFGPGRNNIKHVATDRECYVKVHRTKGSDGNISCNYRTVQLSHAAGRIGKPGEDYVHVEGVLQFEHHETKKEILVEILPKANEGDEHRDEIFGVQIFDAEPAAVKISKKDTCIVEIVTDVESKK